MIKFALFLGAKISFKTCMYVIYADTPYSK